MNSVPWLMKVFRFRVFKVLENAFVKLPLPAWHNLITSPPCITRTIRTHKFALKSLNPHKKPFLEKVSPMLWGGRHHLAHF